MGEPWGLSDPQFLNVDVAGIALTVIIPLAFRAVIRWVPGRRSMRELDPYEVAYLAGGPQRVAELIVAEQVDCGALRVNGRGRLSQAVRTARSGPHAGALDRIKPAGMPDGLTTADICGRLTSDPCMAEIRRDLRSDKMIVSRRRMATLGTVALVPMTALLITGILRVIEEASSHRSFGGLVLLILLGCVVDVVLLARLLRLPPPTWRGSGYVKRARTARQRDLSLAVSGGASARTLATPAILLGVALEGFGGVPEEELRSALLAGMPPPYTNDSSCGD